MAIVKRPTESTDRHEREGASDESGRGSWKRMVLACIRTAVLVFVVLSVAVVFWLRWFPAPTSAVMISDWVGQRFGKDRPVGIHYRWVDGNDISRWMKLAVIASEDQKFPNHWGFDFESVRRAVDEHLKGGRLRGASTITQQTAKNLFLWRERSFIRKGLEAYFAILLELLWPKERIIEVYLNIAQFGDGIYGVGAASEMLLKKEASRLTVRDAALLAAVLPNPSRYSARRPSSYINGRRQWIHRQMRLLGGTTYLEQLSRP